MADLRSLLPDRDWYLKGKHPGTNVWRHARTDLTPAYPRWVNEGSACECGGTLTTYKFDSMDTGVSGPDLHDCPSSDATAGYSVCDTCYAQTCIPLCEVDAGQPGTNNVISFPQK